MNNKLRNFWVGLAVFLFSLCFAINGSDVSSKSLERNKDFFGKSSGKDELSDLTVKIASFSARRKSKNPLEDEQSTDSFAELAERRYERLSGLIETDAAEVLRVALPDEILSRIPERYDAFFEKREQLEGELEVISECGEEDGRTLYYLNNEKGRFSLHFAKQPEGELLTGARLNVKGVRVGEAVVVEENSLQAAVGNLEFDAAAAFSNTFGEQKLLVLLVNFQNNLSQPYTIEQANDIIFNTANTSSVTNYYREASFGQTWITGDTYGWFTLPMNAGCDYAQIASRAKQAAQNAGVNLANYNRYMYVYPANSCGYSGLGTLGGNETWIVGTLTNFRTPIHELGHNLGLHHAKLLNCGTSVLGSSCATDEYGHSVDIMGGGRGHFHSFHKERLGWLNYGSMPTVTTVTQSGNYFIAPYFPNNVSGPKALKILKSVDSQGRKTWYYIESRRKSGFDSSIASTSNLLTGLLFSLNQEASPQENNQLDMNPQTTSTLDKALSVNQTYTDDSLGVSITPLSVGDSGATVSITFGSSSPTPCSQTNPTISVSPSATQWIGAGSSFTYTVTVTNNNSSNCANTSFNVQPTLPAGWSSVVGSPILSLNSGASASTTVQIFAPSSAADGFYTIGFAAVDYAAASYSASTSVSCAVYSSLGVSASPAQSSYTRTQTATVTAYVKANGSPLAGANVTFTMTKANGSRVTSSAVSSADGSAVFSYKFNKKQDPAGTYLVSVNASLNGVSGNGSTSFTVK
ncbi:MAG TPA: NEW3 domain-containing protein [Pyrinomonadaceae bacterium]|nr:NEW3 domain-containing protein [Pyrinomonadaceae bacterium]